MGHLRDIQMMDSTRGFTKISAVVGFENCRPPAAKLIAENSVARRSRSLSG